ncbi:dipeptide/oligopeptide/nickel ABC transporter permease/ATP-binding protein [Microbacterium sp. No. 7]|uniref:dipeptide/oligopeptide/nickel ABC transporter permease/ATP-binding protein n=1 Tax=Microbacterium sp. No. 7 TaxID=1714373 RepID=UPI0009EC1623|nr:dipeptide/oligopeptide/nickel ABC transporter permease/ATP-binding protein [Microbacterium sp. No. 7]
MAERRRRALGPALIIGAALLLIVVAVAVVAPAFVSGPANTLTENRGLPLSREHWLGTNVFGQDNLSRVLVATRLTLVMTLAASAISVGFGIAAGIMIWLAPVHVREWCLRILETAVAYPTLITALIIAAILLPGATTAVIAMGVAGIPGFARVTANLAQRVSHSDYFRTARFLGVSPRHLATRHMIPSMAEPLLILSATVFAATLVEISALSFVGLGVQPPAYDLGSLLNDSLDALYTQPIEAAGPAVMIVLISIAAMFVGDGLAAGANPQAARSWTPRKPDPSPVSRPAPGDEALVRVSDLRIAGRGGEGPVDLVHGIDLHIDRGEILGIVGESGSGKSLTAMSVAGLAADDLSISADTLRVAELNMLGTPSATTLAETISIIYQDPGTTFSPSLRMGTQLTEVMRVHRGWSRTRARAVMIDALEKVGITEPARRMRQYPHELSGGQRQRAMIAAALVTQPALLIADEPTTALDVTVQVEVLRQFARLRAEHGTAILFISHDIGVVQELCDRVLVMRAGRVVEELTPGDIRRRDVRHPYTRTLLDAVPRLTLSAAPAGARTDVHTGGHTGEEGTR